MPQKPDGDLQGQLDVLRFQKEQLDSLKQASQDAQGIEDSISQAEDLLRSLNLALPQSKKVQGSPVTAKEQQGAPLQVGSWDELLQQARENQDRPAVFTDLLSEEDILRVEARLAVVRGDLRSLHRLDLLDVGIAVVAGILAALVDVFLVQMPMHSNFLGDKSSAGGPLANWVRTRINESLPPGEIRKLEKYMKVPYDPSMNTGLQQIIEGLNPHTHRFQSLGHDPILGFLFGVMDIMKGTFSAIDSNGQWIVQANNIHGTAGMNVFDALARQYGHLLSDVSTTRGLPVPFMPLLQFLQVGAFTSKGLTVGDVSTQMYTHNYDFRHFLAMGIPVGMIEVMVRMGYFAKRQHETGDLAQSAPFGNKPKLKSMLLIAHGVATAVNVGKVTLTQNPLAINLPQCMAFVRYLMPELKFWFVDLPRQERAGVQQVLDDDWGSLQGQLSRMWERSSLGPVVF
ncbi:hypothetical protein [Deinococcus roseus]|uniref:Uncharacterized protein n=1 Tax=Deinococcus roseus TaxID=392414 RepID=A0ABQ2DN25_9DEIO|nr:hypothetical protein [Deinococcus roseus]GGJ59440.1 hypothetical protein GCM10008938_51980 [Deinococcus roseus]